MKKFTVKDFIGYNNPCFSCGERISFKLGIVTNGVDGSAQLRPTVKPEYTVVDLKVTYSKTLQLWIFHNTNKFIASNPIDFTEYLNENHLFLHSKCDKCMSSIESMFLEFNKDMGFVKPVSISREILLVNDDRNQFILNSSFAWNKSVLSADRLDKTAPISPIVLDLPLLPLYKFKTKERFLNKVKTYVVFS